MNFDRRLVSWRADTPNSASKLMEKAARGPGPSLSEHTTAARFPGQACLDAETLWGKQEGPGFGFRKINSFFAPLLLGSYGYDIQLWGATPLRTDVDFSKSDFGNRPLSLSSSCAAPLQSRLRKLCSGGSLPAVGPAAGVGGVPLSSLSSFRRRACGARQASTTGYAHSLL